MKVIFLTLGLLLFTAILPAQELNIPPDLKKIVEQSFQYYPRLGEMQDYVSINEVRVGLGKTAFLPVLNGDLSYRLQDPIPMMEVPGAGGQLQEIKIQPANNYNASVFLVQPLIDMRLPTMLSKAKSELETSKDNLESYKSKLAYQVAQIYYAIIFLNKSLYVQGEQISLLKNTLDQISVKVKNGDALNYDLVSTQVKYTNAGNFYTELKSQLDKQYNMLGMLTGNTGKAYLNDTSINPLVFIVKTDSILNKAYENNPDIRIAGDKIKTVGWDIQSAERLRLPVLNLQAGLGYKNGYMPDIDAVNFNYYVGLGISIPILPSSRPAYQKKMALINLNASKLALETQKMTLNKDMSNALDDIRKNQKKLASADTLIHAAQLASDLAADRYKYGVITNLDLLTAVANYKDAQLSRLQFEYNLLISRMDLCQLSGIKWW